MTPAQESKPLTSDERVAIRARTDAATPGPWLVNGPDKLWAAISSGPDSVFHAYVAHDGDCTGCECGRDGEAHVSVSVEDAEFIAHARTDMVHLLDALEAVEAEVARLQANSKPDQNLDLTPSLASPEAAGQLTCKPEGQCNLARQGYAHEPHRWDIEDRMRLRQECPGVTDESND